MADVCICCECTDKVKTRLAETLIPALNTLNNLSVTSLRKLDMIYVLSNEINADNILLNQMANTQAALKTKISEIDGGTPPYNFKRCVEQCLVDIKNNAPTEYDAFLAAVNTYWEGKFDLPAEITQGE